MLAAAIGALTLALRHGPVAVEQAPPLLDPPAATATAPAGEPEAGSLFPAARSSSAEVEPTPAASPVAAAATRPPPARAESPATATNRTATPGFTAAMSQGLAALAAGDLAPARLALEHARTIDAASPGVSEALARLSEQETAAAIRQALTTAMAHESAESWPEAAASYTTALGLDQGLAAAVEGRAHALDRARLGERIAGHVARPDRLLTPAVLAEAEALLDDAAEVEPSGPCLRAQIERLSTIVARARTPVAVVIHSDQATTVTLLRHGALGSFRERRIDLRPGAYTAVGSRPGYRDVRRRFEVVSGTTPDPIEVRCEERI